MANRDLVLAEGGLDEADAADAREGLARGLFQVLATLLPPLALPEEPEAWVCVNIFPDTIRKLADILRNDAKSTRFQMWSGAKTCQYCRG